MAKKKSSMREKAKKKAEKNMNRGGNMLLAVPEGTEFIKPKKGPYNWDVLPYVVSVDNHPEVDKGDRWYQRTYYVHYNVGPDNRAFICPKTVKRACPICEHVKELFNSENDEDVELAKSMKAKERELYNIIDLDDQDKGVQILEYSYHNFGKALDEEIHEGDEELGDFAELEGGRTLQVSFRKKKLGKNEFFEVRKIEFEEREDYDEDILEEVYDLDQLLIIKDYDTIQKELYGVSGEEESKEKDDENENEEDEEKPSSKKKGKKSAADKKKAKSKKKDEDEDEEPPAKKKGKKSSGKKQAKNKCPHGGTFGEDINELDECEDCDLWTECEEKYEETHEDED